DEREEDLGRRLVRVVLEEVVLGRPVVLEADLVAQERHVDLAVVARMLVVPLGAVHLREDPELHAASLRPGIGRIRISELAFGVLYCQLVFQVLLFISCAAHARRPARPETRSTASTSWRRPSRCSPRAASRPRSCRTSRPRPASRWGRSTRSSPASRSFS